MNGEIGRSNSLVRIKLSEDRKGGRRVDQRSDCAAMNYTLVLFKLAANLQVNADFTSVYLAKFQSQ